MLRSEDWRRSLARRFLIPNPQVPVRITWRRMRALRFFVGIDCFEKEQVQLHKAPVNKCHAGAAGGGEDPR